MNAQGSLPLTWLKKEAETKGLEFEDFITVETLNPMAKQHDEYKGFFRFLGKYVREIPDNEIIPTKVHSSAKERFEQSDEDARSIPLKNYLQKYGEWPPIED